MKRKYLLIGVLLLAVCISVSAVSADDSWSFNFDSSSSSESNSNGGELSIDNNKVKIQGFEFTIPEGYKENESFRLVGNDTNQTGFEGLKITQVRFEKDTDSIIIKVLYGDEPLDAKSYTPDPNATSEKLNNIEGYFQEYNDGVSFNYIKDGKLVELFAPDKETLISLFK